MKTNFLFLSLFLASSLWASPKVLLYHSFDGVIGQPDYTSGRVAVAAGKELNLRKPAISGKAAWFAEVACEASLRIELGGLMSGRTWTVALWQILEVKEWLTAPTDNLITLLDAENKPIIKLSKSGGVFVYDGDREVYLDCFDALYWVRGSREHLTLTWDEGGNGVPQPSGILRAYWKARPYAGLAIELKRRPVALEIGQPMAALGVDELYVLDSALSLRAIWELMRYEGGDMAALEKKLTKREQSEAACPTAARIASWAKLVREGQLIEAESNPGDGKVVISPDEKPDGYGRFSAQNSPASTASGRVCVVSGDKPLVFKVNVAEAGEYALALRYVMQRRMLPFWPQNSKARTPWTENFAEVEIRLDGKLLGGVERLFPTGSCSGHRGDVEPWAWHALGGSQKVRLAAGGHTVSVAFKKGIAKPTYDVLLLSKDAGPMPAHARWVDLYRVPPAWWVESKKTAIASGKRVDTYTVTLRNRCDEPCSYEVIVDNERVRPQAVCANVNRIALEPFEEKSIRVTFESDVKLQNHSGWANIYLWNEDTALRQKYRLWNLIPADSVGVIQHPVLSPSPDPEMQEALRQWLKRRDPKVFTPQLREWTRARNYSLSDGAAPVRGFPRPFAGDRLTVLDMWMKLSGAQIEQYLPDGPAEYNGYGSGWERVGVEYSGAWHKQPKVKSIDPTGDIDLVTSMTVEGPPQKGKTEIYTKTYTKEKDPDLISAVRDSRWTSMMGHGLSGGAPYGDTPLGRTSHAGITLLAEAYYLTGDKAYARKAFQMLCIFARKYTGLTKHFYHVLHREDRDWWGGRVGGRYLSKFGPRYYHAMGVYTLDLIWDALTPAERTLIEHNVLRWGMYEAMSGPLFEEPAYFAAVNKEDMPFLPMGRILGDPSPIQGLKFFYDIFKDVVLDDGIHQCSLGSYGGVNTYVSFMEKLHRHGLDVSGNVALRNAFLAHPSFIFSGGGFPNIGDGGGVGLSGLGAGFGCPTLKQYAWAKELFSDPQYDQWPKLIAAAQRALNGPAEKKAERMRKEYLEGDLSVSRLWPDLYIAPVKGLAMLRNKTAAEPVDWKEVIFDYGLFDGRTHGHPAKLQTIPSFNGQIVSMEYGYGMHGNPVAHGFHMRSYAHNVVVADGQDQFHASSAVPVGRLRGSYSDHNVQWVDAESTRIYQGIEMRRTLFVTDFGIVDLYLCRSSTRHQYDWMYHSFGEASVLGLKLAKVKQLAESGPLKFGQNPRTHTTNGMVRVLWENKPLTKPAKKQSTALLHEKALVRVWALPAKDTAVALFGIPMIESCGNEIDYFMLRRNAEATVFATVQEPWRESTQPMVESIQSLHVKANSKLVANHQASAMEVTLNDGSRRVYFVNYTSDTKTIGKVNTSADVATWEIDKNEAIQNPKHTQGHDFKIR